MHTAKVCNNRQLGNYSGKSLEPPPDGLMRLHKFLLMPPIFASEDKKKGFNLLPLDHIITHNLAFLQLLQPLGAPSPPPPLEDDCLKSLKKLASASFS